MLKYSMVKKNTLTLIIIDVDFYSTNVHLDFYSVYILTYEYTKLQEEVNLYSQDQNKKKK